jgi:hypothetical protein
MGIRGTNQRKGTLLAGPAEIDTGPTPKYQTLLNRPSPSRSNSLLVTMSNRPLQKKMEHSVTSESPWKSETPFGPPQIARSPSGGIQRLRNTLHKLSPSAFAEKELLRKKNQHKIPLTQRNIDHLVTEQECNEAYRPRLRQNHR